MKKEIEEIKGHKENEVIEVKKAQQAIEVTEEIPVKKEKLAKKVIEVKKVIRVIRETEVI